MRSRLTRLGVVAAGLLALLGVMTPPAQATTVKTIVFTGTATLDGPLGYPCATSPTSLPPNAKCPGLGVVSTSILPLPITGLPLDNVPNPHVTVTGGNTRSFGFGHSICVDAGFNLLKLDKPITHLPVDSCTIAAGGTVTGWCGLSSGKGNGAITVLGQTYNLVDFNFTGVGGLLIVSGHVYKPQLDQWGKFYALVLAVPVPIVPPVPPGNSCLSKSATTFTLVGGGTIVLITHDIL